jgi:hypothetical protein
VRRIIAPRRAAALGCQRAEGLTHVEDSIRSS